MSVIQFFGQLDITSLPTPSADKGALATVLEIVFGFAGSIAFLMIVIGGFRYILAHGDPNSVSQAKKTILYAVIGLLVCMAAFSIVEFIVRGVA